MYSKKKNTIFTTCIICILVVTSIFFIKKNQGDNPDIKDSMTLSEEELNNLSDSQREAEEKLQKERKEYFTKMLEVSNNPEYHETIYGKTFNKDFVVKSTRFRNPYGMIEYEFLDYEELDNLTSYMSGVDLDNTDGMLENGIFTDTKRLYVERGLLNADGTFNKVTQVERKKQSDGTFGEEIKHEDCELTAVKIKIKYKNLSPKDNWLTFSSLHVLTNFVYGEDGELYQKDFLSRREIVFNTFLPIYNSLSTRFIVEDSIVGPCVTLSGINLKPYEECEAELIYIVLKDELDDMCLQSNWSMGNGDVCNYKDIGTKIVFFSYLKEQLYNN